MKAVEVLIDSSRGQFIPQHFALDCTGWDFGTRRHTLWSITEEQYGVLSAGPHRENYWDIWIDVLMMSKCVSDEGAVYTLHQTENGDILAVCEALMTAREKVDILGWSEEDAGLKPYTVVGFYPDNDQAWSGFEWAENPIEAAEKTPEGITPLIVFDGHIDEASED